MRVSCDQWHLISKHLDVVDLCNLMQVSRDWFHLWISDRAWAHQRQRICNVFPALNQIFELYCDMGASTQHTSKRTEKSNSNKKRKTAWITPRRGIWYIFKKWLMMGTHMKGIKALCKLDHMHPIVLSIVHLCMPCSNLITMSKLKCVPYDGTTGQYETHKIVIKWGGCKYICYIRNLSNRFHDHVYYNQDQTEYIFDGDLWEWGMNEMKVWKRFLFGDPPSLKYHYSYDFEASIKSSLNLKE